MQWEGHERQCKRLCSHLTELPPTALPPTSCVTLSTALRSPELHTMKVAAPPPRAGVRSKSGAGGQCPDVTDFQDMPGPGLSGLTRVNSSF